MFRGFGCAAVVLPDMQALKSALPVFARLVRSADKAPAADLLAPATPEEEHLVQSCSTILKCIAMPRNSKLLAMLPEASLQLLPMTGDHVRDARLMMHLLDDEQCGKLLRKLLEWQNKLRKLVAELLAAGASSDTVCSRC